MTGPTLEDWTTFGISVAFCVIGIALALATEDWRTGVVTLAFFGGCAIVIGGMVLRKRRARDFRALSVSIRGSTDLRLSDGPLVPLCAGMVVVGAVMFFVGTTYGWIFRGIGAFIAALGTVMIALRLAGILRRHYLRFEPEGLVIGERRRTRRVPWDEIRAVSAGEIADNPVVFLSLDGIAAPLALTPWLYGLEVAPLVAALERYAREPAARQELAPPPHALPASLA
ncbi:MAG TPA: hypothetical protein VF280_19405 [Burkholderiales bacterium]